MEWIALYFLFWKIPLEVPVADKYPGLPPLSDLKTFSASFGDGMAQYSSNLPRHIERLERIRRFYRVYSDQTVIDQAIAETRWRMLVWDAYTDATFPDFSEQTQRAALLRLKRLSPRRESTHEVTGPDATATVSHQGAAAVPVCDPRGHVYLP